jgi:hypothetical protein
MRFRKSIAFFLIVLFCTQFSLAQNATTAPDPEKEKEKKEADELIVRMLDQAVADAAFLRLPQNKAIVFGMAGDLYWKFDEKRSRDLFRSAANELLAYNIETEREKRESTEPNFEFFDMNDPRGQILPLVAKNDAELALDILSQTRPAALAEAMLRAAAPDARSDGNMMTFSPEGQKVRQEIALEQRFALLAADDNPDRAIKIIKDSLSKGVSNVVLPLLQKLHKKDEKKAQELAGEVIRKLVDTDLAKKADDLQVSLGFLQFMARPGGNPATPAPKSKPFAFSDLQSKDLANKVASTFLQPSNSVSLMMALSRALPNLEKLVPDKAVMLRQRLADGQKTLPTEMRNSMRMQRLWDQNSTPEQILAEIPKIQNEMERNAAYQALGSKISQVTDEARARRLVDQISDEKVRSRALEQLEAAKISRLAGSGKLDEARKMISTLTDKKIQVQKLVALALSAYKKDSETDADVPKSLLKDARSMINETPEDEDELANLMEVVKGYATIEPDMAFRLFEPTIEQFNDVIQATAILSKYNKRNRAFKKGEMVLRASGNTFDGIPLFRYLNHVQLLGKADLARMNQLSDRFQRSDARTLIKLIVVQGMLKDDRKPEAYSGNNFFN